jgi:hypothetical protein
MALPDFLPEPPPADAPFVRLAQRVRGQLWSLCEELFLGKIDADIFGKRAIEILQDGHARAARFGRVRAGVLGPLGDEDRFIADLIMREQSAFLQRFVNDLKSDKYIGADGEFVRSPINARAQLYAARLRGTANDTFVNASDAGVLFEWILIAEDNCNDCPMIAANGPYNALTLPAKPGDGRTECITNCKCILLREDGVLGPTYPYTEPGEEPL